jgi:hypothetical protein
VQVNIEQRVTYSISVTVNSGNTSLSAANAQAAALVSDPAQGLAFAENLLPQAVSGYEASQLRAASVTSASALTLSISGSTIYAIQATISYTLGSTASNLPQASSRRMMLQSQSRRGLLSGSDGVSVMRALKQSSASSACNASQPTLVQVTPTSGSFLLSVNQGSAPVCTTRSLTTTDVLLTEINSALASISNWATSVNAWSSTVSNTTISGEQYLQDLTITIQDNVRGLQCLLGMGAAD